jgi:hypothetical protein
MQQGAQHLSSAAAGLVAMLMQLQAGVGLCSLEVEVVVAGRYGWLTWKLHRIVCSSQRLDKRGLEYGL